MAITLRLLAHLSKEIDRGNIAHALQWARQYIPPSDPLYRALLYRSRDKIASQSGGEHNDNARRRRHYWIDSYPTPKKGRDRSRRPYYSRRKRCRPLFLSHLTSTIQNSPSLKRSPRNEIVTPSPPRSAHHGEPPSYGREGVKLEEV